MNFNIQLAKTSTLLKAFNLINSDKPVKKFADAKTAIRRVEASLVALHELMPDPAVEALLQSVEALFQGDAVPVPVPTPAPTPAPVAVPAFEANVFQTEFLQALVNLIGPGNKNEYVMLCDIEVQLSKRAKAGAGSKAIAGGLKAQGFLEDKGKITDVFRLTLAGAEYCKNAGIATQEAYQDVKQRDTAKSEPAKQKKAASAKTPAAKKTADSTFTYHPNPKRTPHAVREGTKIATIIDLTSRAQGVTLSELQTLMSPKSTVRGVLQYDLNALVGYGCVYDGKVVRLILPKGMNAPLPHVEAKGKKTVAAKKGA